MQLYHPSGRNTAASAAAAAMPTTTTFSPASSSFSFSCSDGDDHHQSSPTPARAHPRNSTNHTIYKYKTPLLRPRRNHNKQRHADEPNRRAQEVIRKAKETARTIAQDRYEQGPGMRRSPSLSLLPETDHRKKKARKTESAYISRFNQEAYGQQLEQSLRQAANDVHNIQRTRTDLQQENNLLKLHIQALRQGIACGFRLGVVAATPTHPINNNNNNSNNTCNSSAATADDDDDNPDALVPEPNKLPYPSLLLPSDFPRQQSYHSASDNDGIEEEEEYNNSDQPATAADPTDCAAASNPLISTSTILETDLDLSSTWAADHLPASQPLQPQFEDIFASQDGLEDCFAPSAVQAVSSYDPNGPMIQSAAPRCVGGCPTVEESFMLDDLVLPEEAQINPREQTVRNTAAASTVFDCLEQHPALSTAEQTLHLHPPSSNMLHVDGESPMFSTRSSPSPLGSSLLEAELQACIHGQWSSADHVMELVEVDEGSDQGLSDRCFAERDAMECLVSSSVEPSTLDMEFEAQRAVMECLDLEHIMLCGFSAPEESDDPPLDYVMEAFNPKFAHVVLPRPVEPTEFTEKSNATSRLSSAA